MKLLLAGVAAIAGAALLSAATPIGVAQAMTSARPWESRSIVANCWNTRTGSSDDSTVTALVSRMRIVRTAAPRLPVLSYAELGPQLQLETLGVVNLAQPATV